MAPSPITSPCIGICVIDDETGWCQGCARSLDEIARWVAMGATARAEVMASLPARHDGAASHRTR